MQLRNQWLLLCVTLLVKLCTFFALCLALYVQPKSLHHEHVHNHNSNKQQTANTLVSDKEYKKDSLQ